MSSNSLKIFLVLSKFFSPNQLSNPIINFYNSFHSLGVFNLPSACFGSFTYFPLKAPLANGPQTVVPYLYLSKIGAYSTSNLYLMNKLYWGYSTTGRCKFNFSQISIADAISYADHSEVPQ